MAAFGFSLDDLDEQVIEIWPDVAPSLNVFKALNTQWRIGLNGCTGLDYNCIPAVMDLMDIDDRATVFDDIRLMESVALKEMHKKSE